jgi:prepilin-type N-terminal cleavage/methylation domain-containing protein
VKAAEKFTLYKIIIYRRNKMRRGFTLLELIIVIVIIGILATLGIQQYGRMVERSRGAEARQILGQIRSSAASYFTQHRTMVGFTNADAGIINIGAGATEGIPDACTGTHYFSYTIDAASQTAQGFSATATRCIAGQGGKLPDGPAANTLQLVTNFFTGADNWVSLVGGY